MSKNKKIIIGIVIVVVLCILGIVVAPFVSIIYYDNFGLDNERVLEKSIENVSEHYDNKYLFEYIDHEDYTMGFFGVSTTPSIELSVEGFNRSIDASFDRRLLCPFIGFKLKYTDLDKIRVYEEIEDKANEFIKTYIDEDVFLACYEYSHKEDDSLYRSLDTSIKRDGYSFDVNINYPNSDRIDTLNFCIEYGLYNSLSEEEILDYINLIKDEFELDFIALSVLSEGQKIEDNMDELLDNHSYYRSVPMQSRYGIYDKVLIYGINNDIVIIEENNG